MDKIKVYLAGNLHSAWRDELLGKLEMAGVVHRVELLCPHATDQCGDQAAAFYVPRDLLLLSLADIVFAMVNDLSINSGTSAEVGYAYALGKPIIMCRLSSKPSFDFIAALATTVQKSFDSAVEVLVFVVEAGNMDKIYHD